MYHAENGVEEVYLVFLFLIQNIDSWYSLERLAEAVLTCTHFYVLSRNIKTFQNSSDESFKFYS